MFNGHIGDLLLPMDILLLLIPLSLILVGVIAWLLLWAASNGQFDDLEGPAHSVLMDDDKATPRTEAAQQNSASHPPLP